jgi:hypothetical protein
VCNTPDTGYYLAGSDDEIVSGICGSVCARPSIQFLGNGSRFTPDQPLLLFGNSTVDWTWSVFGPDKNIFSLGTHQLMSPTAGSGSAPANLVVAAGVFTEGVMYTFRLAAQQPNGIAAVDLLLSANTLPSGGVAYCTPVSGTAVQTMFTIITYGWTDVDDDPIRFRFGYLQPSGLITQLSPFISTAKVENVVLPQGREGPADDSQTNSTNYLTLTAQAKDVYGGLSQTHTQVIVGPLLLPATTSLATAAVSLITATRESQDPYRTVQVIDSLSSALNVDDQDTLGGFDERVAAREVLLDTLSDIVLTSLPSSTDGNTTNKLVITADAAERLTSSFSSLVKEPAELTDSAADVAIDAIAHVTEAAVTVDYPLDPVVNALSSLLKAADLQSDAKRRRRRTQDDFEEQLNDEQDRHRSNQLSNIVDSVGETVANRMLDGQTPTTISSSAFNMTVGRNSKSQLENSVIEGVVQVPLGALNTAKSESLKSQVVQYNGLGPLFATPKSLNDGDARGERVSGVTSVTFSEMTIDDNGMPTAREMNITNLTTPFLVTMPAQNALANFSTNLENRTLEDVEAFIAGLWNRTTLMAETMGVFGNLSLSTIGCSINSSLFEITLAEEQRALRKREEEDNIYCPSRRDSCAAAQREMVEATGCHGVRGGAEDCARWPEDCNCLRGALLRAYLADEMQCSFWDGEQWRKDGILVESTEDSSTCAFTHLTSFSTFIGPPPSFNRMSFEGVFSM